MNHLLAKLKGKGKGFVKVISNADFFEMPSGITDPIPYEASHTPDQDEWFVIPVFSSKDYCIDFLKNDFVEAEYSQITVEQYKSIKYLVAVQDNFYYFQNLSGSKVLQKKFFTVGTAPVLVEDKIIVLETIPDAIYDGANDALYFKNLSAIGRIFKGIDVLFKDATDEETGSFLSSDFILLSDDYCAQKVNKPNRKRIALAVQALNSFSPVDKATIFQYIKDYYSDLQFSETEQAFSISNDEDLKKLTFGIEQRYYTTIVGGQKRVASSVRTIG